MTTGRWIRDEDVLWRWTADGVLLLEPAAEECCEVTGPGGLLWALLAEPLTVGEAATTLAEHYGVSVELVERELSTLFHDLAGRGAIRSAP